MSKPLEKGGPSRQAGLLDLWLASVTVGIPAITKGGGEPLRAVAAHCDATLKSDGIGVCTDTTTLLVHTPTIVARLLYELGQEYPALVPEKAWSKFALLVAGLRAEAGG